MRTIETPAGSVRRGTLLKVQPFMGGPFVGSVLDIVPEGRNGRTTLTLECGDAGRWCYLGQVTEILDF